MTASSKSDGGEAGTIAIEYALLLPVLLALLFGIIDAARVVWAQATLQHAVESAARCGAVDDSLCPSSDAVEAYAAKRALNLAAPSAVFTATDDACGAQVSATYTLALTLPWNGTNSISLGAVACYPL